MKKSKLKWQFTGQKQLGCSSGKICRNICWKKSTGCFADAWVPFRFLHLHFLPGATQSTRGNVVNFCYDRLRDNPTIAKHFVYLSHSHKSSGILKKKKEGKKKNILVFWWYRPLPPAASCADTWQASISILIVKSAPVIKPDALLKTPRKKLFRQFRFFRQHSKAEVRWAAGGGRVGKLISKLCLMVKRSFCFERNWISACLNLSIPWNWSSFDLSGVQKVPSEALLALGWLEILRPDPAYYSHSWSGAEGVLFNLFLHLPALITGSSHYRWLIVWARPPLLYSACFVRTLIKSYSRARWPTIVSDTIWRLPRKGIIC